MQYTNLECSKQLREWGCDIQPEMSYFMSKWMQGTHDFDIEDTENVLARVDHAKGKEDDFQIIHYPAYDLLWDVCVKYLDDFFPLHHALQDSLEIFRLVKKGKIEEANQYLLDHTVFNPKNK